jgi:catechol 2,3-dioxygenase-like lactoylglutathione lyase family enzyme
VFLGEYPVDRAAFVSGVSGVTELRVALTVPDFDEALAFYRDALGLEQIADWSSDAGASSFSTAAGRRWSCSTRRRRRPSTGSKPGAAFPGPSGSRSR